MNGEPIEKMLDRLEDYILRIERKTDGILELVHSINATGCAKGEADEKRIDQLE